MFDKLKRLGTDTAIYGVSTVVGRFLTFILTPFYTNILPPAELGIVATLYAYIAFVNILYGYGMEAAYMKYTATLELGTKKQNFSVPFISLGLSSVIFSSLIFLNHEALAVLASVPAEFAVLVSYSAGILLLDALAIVPFASLRMERKARIFAILKLLNIVLTVVLNFVFLLHFKLGIEGIFLSNLIASAVTLMALLPVIVSQFTVHWMSPLWRKLMQFSLPTIPAYIATIMVQVIDRPILESLTDKATVGIYQANYRLGIFMMLVVSMFDFAWRPFFLTQAKESDAKPLFARVVTYFFLLMTGCFLLITFFLNDVVTYPIYHGRSILDARYWSGLSIVPVVLLAYMFLGISNGMVAGVYIEKQTQKLPVVTFIGAGVNVAANFLLIPLWGIMGAAVATLLSYSIMAIVLYFIVQKIYPIDYEFVRMAKIAGAAGLVFGLHVLVPFTALALLWKLFLLALFGALMYWLKFFEPQELSLLSRLFSSAKQK